MATAVHAVSLLSHTVTEVKNKELHLMISC